MDTVRSLSTSRGNITIRPALVDDAARLLDLRLEALSAHPVAFAADFDATKERGAEAWVERIRQNAALGEGVIYVASVGDDLIGMTGVYREHWPKTRHAGLIWGVYVRPGWRGLRVADALLGECMTWARAQGMTILKLGVVTSNLPAIRSYARCGFAVYGVDPQVIRYQDAFHDELLMARRL